LREPEPLLPTGAHLMPGCGTGARAVAWRCPASKAPRQHRLGASSNSPEPSRGLYNTTGVTSQPDARLRATSDPLLGLDRRRPAATTGPSRRTPLPCVLVRVTWARREFLPPGPTTAPVIPTSGATQNLPYADQKQLIGEHSPAAQQALMVDMRLSG